MFRRLLRSLLPHRMRLTSHLAHHVDSCSAGRIVSGPFRGHTYPTTAVGSVWRAKVVGSYELELRQIVETICSEAPEVLVVAGAAEGYYAVGLAIRVPAARMIAYEADPQGRELLQQNWQLNGLAPERLQLGSICTLSALRADLQGLRNAWMLMDVEGSEALLADPEMIPELKGMHMLIEIHEFALPGVGNLLRERFRDSHRIDEVPARPRTGLDFPDSLWPRFGRDLFKGAAIALMDEGRPHGMSWLILRADQPDTDAAAMDREP